MHICCIAVDVLHDPFLAEDAVHNAFVSVANLAPVYTLYSQKIYLWRIFGRYFYIGYGRSNKVRERKNIYTIM